MARSRPPGAQLGCERQLRGGADPVQVPRAPRDSRAAAAFLLTSDSAFRSKDALQTRLVRSRDRFASRWIPESLHRNLFSRLSALGPSPGRWDHRLGSLAVLALREVVELRAGGWRLRPGTLLKLEGGGSTGLDENRGAYPKGTADEGHCQESKPRPRVDRTRSRSQRCWTCGRPCMTRS